MASDKATAETTKPGFGSFNSGNVDDMIRSDEWVPPDRPQFIQDLLDSSVRGQKLTFGRKMREQHFLLDSEWTFVNHGAFGSPLSVSFEAANLWRRHTEMQPLRFIDRELFPYVVKVTKRFAKLINCKATDVVLVPNATTALNAVFNSVPLCAQDSVFFLDCTYASVKKMIKHRCKAVGAVPIEHKLPLSPSLDNATIVNEVSENLPPDCKLAVFDHVTSNEALMLPVADLTRLCHERGIMVLIDGAHGLGATALDVENIGADYYAGNCHKWFCAPRGVGFLYANHALLRTRAPADWVELKEEKETVCGEKACERVTNSFRDVWGEPRAPLISHGHRQGFMSEFIWDGARDYSAVLGVELCLDVWDAAPLAAATGDDAAPRPVSSGAYSRRLLRWAVDLLASRWTSSTLLPLEMCATMALVRLPQALQPAAGDDAVDAARQRQDALYQRQVECPVKTMRGELYVRISSWVHNGPGDYAALALAVEELAGITGLEDPTKALEEVEGRLAEPEQQDAQ